MNKEKEEQIINSQENREIKHFQELIQRNGEKPEYLIEINKRKVKINKIRDNFQSENHKIAQQLARWKPYDQNASSPFFDPEWMFGIKDGFDIVIGNPPYISAVSMARSLEEKQYYKKKFPEAIGSYDIYILFLLRTLDLISRSGNYCWIIPNKFLIADYASLTKKKLLSNGLILSIDVSTFEVFKNTSVYPIIILGSKFKNRYKDFQELLLDNYTDLEAKKFRIPFVLKEHKTFADFNIKFGSGATGFEASILKSLISSVKNNNSIPFVVSGGIDKYSFSNTNIRFMGTKFSKAYIKFSNKIAKSKWIFWNSPKIVIAGMTKEIEAVFVKKALALGVGTYAIYSWNDFNPKYLTGLLNSKYLSFYVQTKFKDKHLSGGYLAINKSTLEKLPLVFSENQNEVAIIVDYIHFLKNELKKSYFFELLIDSIAYELFFPNKIKKANTEVIKYLTNIPELKEEWDKDKKLEIIREVYEELSSPNHPVSIAMEKQKTIPEVRIIESLPE
jgi:hypothetical protein